MKLRPLNDYVFIRLNKPAETTASGIIIKQVTEAAPDNGQVLHAYDERLVGKKVFFPQYGGQFVIIDNEKLLVIKEKDLLAIEHWWETLTPKCKENPLITKGDFFMGVINIQHDTQINTHMSVHEFAQKLHQLDLENIPPEKRGIAVLRHLTRMASSEAANPVDQRRILSNYLAASKNDPSS